MIYGEGDNHLKPQSIMDILIQYTFSVAVKENFHSLFTILNITSTNRCKRFSVGNEKNQILGVRGETHTTTQTPT
jgi:hypothetical protein